ncbi:MAG: rod shape-determining protein MreD [Chromatiales bacterium]|nr:rod shape-determining protein MreD [Chromatiales bacterium]
MTRLSVGTPALVIGGTLLLALALTALPVPPWAAIWRPAWVALVLIYWCMAVPSRIGVLAAWTVGLLLDVLSGTLLGQHALGLALVAYVTHETHRRVRVLPLWQQAVSVFVLVFVYQMLLLWINGIQGLPVVASAYWTAPLVSTLLWPWVFVVLRDVRRKYRIV